MADSPHIIISGPIDDLDVPADIAAALGLRHRQIVGERSYWVATSWVARHHIRRIDGARPDSTLVLMDRVGAERRRPRGVSGAAMEMIWKRGRCA